MSKNYIINNIELDNYQMQLLNCNTNSLVIAGAGAGKTLTILGKIKYLINMQNISPEDILVISFTNASVNDIKCKIGENVEIYTFHKLSMKLLDEAHISYTICNEYYLNYIINESLLNCPIRDQKVILKFLKLSMDYSHFIKSDYFLSFSRLILTFINLWKTNNKKYSDIPLDSYNKIDKKILLFIFKIYKTYIQEKESINSYDFDDLILKATKIISKIKLTYKYIIIDEYQDTSSIRLELIAKLVEHTSSKIIVVGDDWQSIYRFSGCNLHLFLNFKNYFSNVTPIKLVNTYRNSQELIDIAAEFILKNPLQIEKNLISEKHQNHPLIFVPTINNKNVLKQILDYFISKNEHEIMILVRNKKDIYQYIDNNFTVDKNCIIYRSISFSLFTVHKSKGLESKYVIILNCNNNLLGFPNQIENNRLIDKMYHENEIKFAEERRLFYVAITRCKEQTFLVYNKNNPSLFIKEIKRIVKRHLNKIDYFKII